MRFHGKKNIPSFVDITNLDIKFCRFFNGRLKTPKI